MSTFYDGPFQGTSKDLFQSHRYHFLGKMSTLYSNKNHSPISGKDEGSAIFCHGGPRFTSVFTTRDAKLIKTNKQRGCMGTFIIYTQSFYSLFNITTVIQIFYFNMERSES